MSLRIADTFTASLARLTGDEQKAVKTTAFDLQINPAHPGMSFHKLDKARDRELLVLARQQRYPADRAQSGRQPAAVLCRSRRRLSVGRAAPVGDSSDDRRRTVGAGARTHR